MSRGCGAGKWELAVVGGAFSTLDSAVPALFHGAFSRPSWVAPPTIRPVGRRGSPQCRPGRVAVAPPAGWGRAAPSRWAEDAQPVCCSNGHAVRRRAQRLPGPNPAAVSRHPQPPLLSHEWGPELEPVKMKMSSEGSWVAWTSLDLSFPIRNRGRRPLARWSSGQGLVQLWPVLRGQDLTKLRPLPGPRFPIPAQTFLSAERLAGPISPGSRNSRASSLSLGSWWSGCHLSLRRSSEEALDTEGRQPEQGEAWRHAGTGL